MLAISWRSNRGGAGLSDNMSTIGVQKAFVTLFSGGIVLVLHRASVIEKANSTSAVSVQRHRVVTVFLHARCVRSMTVMGRD